jgi:hypothetical protein
LNNNKLQLFEIDEYKNNNLTENQIVSMEKLYYLKETDQIDNDSFNTKKKGILTYLIKKKSSIV